MNIICAVPFPPVLEITSPLSVVTTVLMGLRGGTINNTISMTMDCPILIPKKDTTAPKVLWVLNRLPRQIENKIRAVM